MSGMDLTASVDFDDDDPDDEVAAFLPIFLPIDRNYESKYLYQGGNSIDISGILPYLSLIMLGVISYNLSAIAYNL